MKYSIFNLPTSNFQLKSLIFIFCLLLTTTVSAQKTTIKGKIENKSFTQANLQLLYKDDGVSFGKTKVNPDGSFRLTATIPQTDLYKLVFEEGQFAMLCLSPNQNIELTLNANNFADIIFVKGSPSIEFCKTTYEMFIQLNLLGDSVNKALQADKDVQFFSEFQSRFKPYFDANTDADEYSTLVAKTTDSLKLFVNTKTNKGKVDAKEIDVFIYTASNFLRDIAANYSKYANYMQSIGQLYDIKTNKNQKFTSFYEASVDKYLDFVEHRNTTMKSSFAPFVAQIQLYLNFRDSLMLNDLLGKKKEKELLVAKIIELSTISPNAKEIEIGLVKNAELADGFGKYAQQLAQRRASEMVQNYQKFFDTERENKTKVIIDYLLTNKSDIAVLLFIDNFPRDKIPKLHQDVVNALYEKYPNSPLVIERYQIESSAPKSTDIGAMAPDLAFENPDGKIYKLSDLRGKVVLLDFWAAWCRPCRQENPNVVRTYQKYHEKGFEVYSVSLDRDKASWVKAIEADGLVWPYHVSDLGFWNSKAAKIYGVSSIPATFLIDKDGRIVAKNLRGAALENALKELFE
jgi:peroxiredoxin